MIDGYRVDTSHNEELIFQELYRVQNSQAELLSRRIVNAQEEGARKALIEMGWTPPREDDR